MTQAAGNEQGNESQEEMEHISVVLNHVTEILGNIESRERFPDIVGQSRIIRTLFGQILKVAPTDSTALLSGESGTGKAV